MSKRKKDVKVEEVNNVDVEPEEEFELEFDEESKDEPLIRINKAKLFAGVKKAGKVLALIGAGAAAATLAIAMRQSGEDEEDDSEEPLRIEDKNLNSEVDDVETNTEPDVVVQDF